MGCGCSVKKGEVAPQKPKVFLHTVSPKEFVRSLDQEEQKDKKRLLQWFRLISNGDFDDSYAQDPEQLEELAVKLGVPNRYRWLVWRCLANWKDDKHNRFESLSGQTAENIQDAINKDLRRTFPEHPQFDEIGQASLERVLRAYSIYNPDVGYCQGMNFIAAFLLIFLPEIEAFWIFSQLMDHYGASLLFMKKMSFLKMLKYQYSNLLRVHLPAVFRCLEENGIAPDLYAVQWFLTLFTYSFDFNTVVRIWDMIFARGLNSIVFIALAIVKILQPKILSSPSEDIISLFRDRLRHDPGLSGENIIRVATSYRSTIAVDLRNFERQWRLEEEDDAIEVDRGRTRLTRV